MPVGPGPRFFIEAVFIVAVAVIAAISKLSTLGIILSIGAAWALVAAVEWTASRRAPRPVPAEGAFVPEQRPSLLKRLRERPEREAAAQLGAEPALQRDDSALQHVRVLPNDKQAAAPAPPPPPPLP